MTVVYRDELGTVAVQIEFDSVAFIDGFCEFESNKRYYKIPVSALIAINRD